MIAIPQSVTIRVPLKAYSSADHISPVTGATVAVVISKNSGAFSNPSGGATNATEISDGWYYVDLSTTDAGTLGPLIIRGTAASTDPIEVIYQVVNAHNAGFDGVPAATAEASGGLPTLSAAQSSSGTIQAAVLTINSTSQQDIADAIMNRDSSNFEATAPTTSLGGAVIGSTHKITEAANIQTIYKQDDTTAYATRSLTPDTTLAPVKDISRLA